MKNYVADEVYIINDARLMAEWDWKKNEECNLDPHKLTPGSGKKANWICSKGHRWVTAISHRATRGTNCPYCSNKLVLTGFNDIESKYPKLIVEWDYEKNNASGLYPDRLTDGIQIKAWWECEKGHSYQASPYYRIKKQGGCPYCSHQKLLKGFNDLETLYPEVLNEWDYEKNDFPPNEIMAHTLKKVWWICKSGHSYLMNTASRTRGRGCPICAMATHTSFPEQAIYFYIKKVFPDALNAYRQFKQELDIYIPSIETAIEYDGYRAHKSKLQKDLSKSELCKRNNIQLIRLREDNLPRLDDEYSTIILLKQSSIEELDQAIHKLFDVLKVSVDINVARDEIDIKERYDNFKKDRSLQDTDPALAKQWHPVLNGNITPENVYAKTGHKYWWKCEKGHEWQASPAKRVSNNRGCPFCTNQSVLKGYNDLATLFPKLAKQWSPNNALSPDEVVGMSSKAYLWIGDCGHEWKAALSSRRKGVGCPYCANQKVLKGFNDLATVHPELLTLWDYEKNVISVDEVLAGGGKKYWWKCPQCNNSWAASMCHIISGTRCPICGNKDNGKKNVLSRVKKNGTFFDHHPELLSEWDKDKNENILLSEITEHSRKCY